MSLLTPSYDANTLVKVGGPMYRNDPWVSYKANKFEDEKAINEYLTKGGKVARLKEPSKNFRDTPKGGGFFLFSREERLEQSGNGK